MVNFIWINSSSPTAIEKSRNNKEHQLTNLFKVSAIDNETKQDDLNIDDYREVRKEIIEKIIKPNFHEWRIEKMCFFDGNLWNLNDEPPFKIEPGFKQSTTALIHKSAELKWEKNGLLIIDKGRIHFKEAFTDQEWTEIELVVPKVEFKKTSIRDYMRQKNILIIFFALFLFFILLILKKIRGFSSPSANDIPHRKQLQKNCIL